MDTFSPAGLRVLVVDDDPLCLLVLDRMLKKCNYKVTTSKCAKHALNILRDSEEHFDLVLSDVYMPDVDGFKLLEIIGLELDLPVIMMSANGDTSVVMKGITHGACDYLIKPVRMEELRNIWQHLVRRKEGELPRLASHREGMEIINTGDSLENCSKKRKEVGNAGKDLINDVSTLKKARVKWSVDLHQRFVNAVNRLGVEKAVAKKLLDLMNVKGLTRENVASHLQKYRLYLKQLSGVVPAPCPIASYQALDDGKPGGMMCILPGGRSMSSTPGTRKSPTKHRACQEHKQRNANRAQVLGAPGFVDTQPLAALLTCETKVPSSYFQLQNNHSQPFPWYSGDYAVKLEDNPRSPQVEGFVDHWNINQYYMHEVRSFPATDVTGRQHNHTLGDAAHMSFEINQTVEQTVIRDDGSGCNHSHEMYSSMPEKSFLGLNPYAAVDVEIPGRQQNTILGDATQAGFEINQTGKHSVTWDIDASGCNLLHEMYSSMPTEKSSLGLNLDHLDLVPNPEQLGVCDYFLYGELPFENQAHGI